MVLFSQNFLRDWLMAVFSQTSSDYDFTEGVGIIISELEDYYTDWTRELTAGNPGLKGKSVSKWYPAACAQYLMHVGFYAYSKFGKRLHGLDNHAMVLLGDMARRTLSKKERTEIIRLFEEEWPDSRRSANP